MKGKRIMVVTAHPDDADYYAGGTIAKWVQQGAEVAYLICTDDSVGTEDPNTTPEEHAALRKKEQAAANEALGVSHTVYLDYPDAGLYPTEELRINIVRELRRFRPHVVVTFDPWLRYELHPDHTACGFETVYARIACKLPLKYPFLIEEGFKPWTIDHLYLFKTNNPNLWVDIEDVLELKLKALACHVSQFGMMIPSVDQGMPLLRELSNKDANGRVVEGLRHIPLEGLAGLKAYIAVLD